MTTRSSRSIVASCALLLVTGAIGLVTLHARATFTVDPMQLQLSRQATSQLVTVTNESMAELRFEIKAYKWSHDESGEAKLTAADDIVLFPNLVSVASHAQQRVRVGTTAPYGAVEGDYRLFVEELPPADTGASGPPRVSMRTRIGIPLFLAPITPSPRAEVTDVRYSNGQVTARVRNTGNMHVVVGTVQFRGTPAGSTTQTFDHSVTGWYVLPGLSQVFQVPVTRAECQATGRITVQARVNDQTLTATGDSSPSSCGH